MRKARKMTSNQVGLLSENLHDAIMKRRGFTTHPAQRPRFGPHDYWHIADNIGFNEQGHVFISQIKTADKTGHAPGGILKLMENATVKPGVPDDWVCIAAYRIVNEGGHAPDDWVERIFWRGWKFDTWEEYESWRNQLGE